MKDHEFKKAHRQAASAAACLSQRHLPAPAHGASGVNHPQPSLFPASGAAGAAGSATTATAQPIVSTAVAPLPPASAPDSGPASAAACAAPSVPPVRPGSFGAATMTQQPTFRFGSVPMLSTAAAPSAPAASAFTFGSGLGFRGLPSFGAASSVVGSTVATSAAAAGSQPLAAAPGPFGSPPRPSFPPLRMGQTAAAGSPQPTSASSGPAQQQTLAEPTALPVPSKLPVQPQVAVSAGAPAPLAVAAEVVTNQAVVTPPQPAAGTQSDRTAIMSTPAAAALNPCDCQDIPAMCQKLVSLHKYTPCLDTASSHAEVDCRKASMALGRPALLKRVALALLTGAAQPAVRAACEAAAASTRGNGGTASTAPGIVAAAAGSDGAFSATCGQPNNMTQPPTIVLTSSFTETGNKILIASGTPASSCSAILPSAPQMLASMLTKKTAMTPVGGVFMPDAAPVPHNADGPTAGDTDVEDDDDDDDDIDIMGTPAPGVPQRPILTSHTRSFSHQRHHRVPREPTPRPALPNTATMSSAASIGTVAVRREASNVVLCSELGLCCWPLDTLVESAGRGLRKVLVFSTFLPSSLRHSSYASRLQLCAGGVSDRVLTCSAVAPAHSACHSRALLT